MMMAPAIIIEAAAKAAFISKGACEFNKLNIYI